MPMFSRCFEYAAILDIYSVVTSQFNFNYIE